jgi:hypothetical protein
MTDLLVLHALRLLESPLERRGLALLVRQLEPGVCADVVVLVIHTHALKLQDHAHPPRPEAL